MQYEPPDLDDYEYQQSIYSEKPDMAVRDPLGLEESVYRKATDTVYRLENWSAEELEMYCGIYKEGQ